MCSEMSFTNQIRLYKWLCFDLAASLIPIHPHLLPHHSRPHPLPHHSCPHSHPHSHPCSPSYFHFHSHIGGTHFSYNHASDVNDIMRLMSIRQWFGWDRLCERYYAADVDQATGWPRRTLRYSWCKSDNSLTKTHSVSDSMRLTWIGQRFVLWVTSCDWRGSGNSWAAVWHYKNSIESKALPQKEHLIEFNDFMIFQCCGAPFGIMGVVLTHEGNLY